MSGRIRLLLLTASLLTAPAAFAQGLLILEFSFSNPGARSLGFGGAFVALADDATAAYANPAGLVQLTRPEVSVEGRSWSFSTPFVAGGRASGAPTGLGIDTIPGLRWEESSADLTGLSYLSYVHPRQRWSFAIYRHLLARFTSTYATDGLFAVGSTYLDTDRRLDQVGSTELEVVSWGFAAARRITESLSLGLGLTYLQVDMDIGATTYLPADDTLEAFFSSNPYLPERSPWWSTTRAHDSTVGLNLGLLLRATEHWRLGCSVHSKFAVDAHWLGIPGPASTPENLRQWDFAGDWDFPWVFSLGGAYTSPGGHLTVSFEWDRVLYSEIIDQDPDESIPDADELHLGGEYAFLSSRPVIALRLGIWLDPDHRLQATRGDDLFRTFLAPGSDELHYAFGIGAAFERFQIDLGADFSDFRDTLSLSAIFSF